MEEQTYPQPHTPPSLGHTPTATQSYYQPPRPQPPPPTSMTTTTHQAEPEATTMVQTHRSQPGQHQNPRPAPTPETTTAARTPPTTPAATHVNTGNTTRTKRARTQNQPNPPDLCTHHTPASSSTDVPATSSSTPTTTMEAAFEEAEGQTHHLIANFQDTDQAEQIEQGEVIRALLRLLEQVISRAHSARAAQEDLQELWQAAQTPPTLPWPPTRTREPPTMSENENGGAHNPGMAIAHHRLDHHEHHDGHHDGMGGEPLHRRRPRLPDHRRRREHEGISESD